MGIIVFILICWYLISSVQLISLNLDSVLGVRKKGNEMPHVCYNLISLFQGVRKDVVERGMFLSHSGKIKQHDNIMAQVYIRMRSEGGRDKPVMNNYINQVCLRCDVYFYSSLEPEMGIFCISLWKMPSYLTAFSHCKNTANPTCLYTYKRALIW